MLFAADDVTPCHAALLIFITLSGAICRMYRVRYDTSFSFTRPLIIASIISPVAVTSLLMAILFLLALIMFFFRHYFDDFRLFSSLQFTISLVLPLAFRCFFSIVVRHDAAINAYNAFFDA